MNATDHEFPTAVESIRCIEGSGEACYKSAGIVAGRTILLATGMALAGERHRLARKAIVGSLAVQAFVMLWSGAGEPHMRSAALPSGAAALSGNIWSIAYTYLMRTMMVGTGLFISGESKHLIRNSFAGTAAIEISVLLWAARERDKAKEDTPAASIVPVPQLPHEPQASPTAVLIEQ